MDLAFFVARPYSIKPLIVSIAGALSHSKLVSRDIEFRRRRERCSHSCLPVYSGMRESKAAHVIHALREVTP